MPTLYTSEQPLGPARVLCTFEIEPGQDGDAVTEPFPENVILRSVLINGEEVSTDFLREDWVMDTEQRIWEERRNQE